MGGGMFGVGVVPLVSALTIGLVIGVLSGMLGIGGGTIMIPVFKLGFGMAPMVCTATSLFAIILTAISGSIGHIRGKTCVPKLGLVVGLGGAITSPLGVWLANMSPDWAIMVAATCVILYSAATMFRKALKTPSAAASSSPASTAATTSTLASASAATDTSSASATITTTAAAPTLTSTAFAPIATIPNEIVSRETFSEVSDDRPRVTRKQVLVGAFIGMAAGVASGYVGIGGGFLIVPMMLQLLKMPMRLTSGTSLIAVMTLAIPGVVMQATYGNVDWLIGTFMAIGTMPGAFIGARLMSRVPERTLRFLFAGFLLVAAAALILDQLHIL